MKEPSLENWIEYKRNRAIARKIIKKERQVYRICK